MHIHFSQIWKNIAEEFSTYNDKLIFEGFNEILDDNANWINPDFEAIKAVNKYNQLFVNTIRKSGGYNSNRMLCVNTYAASSENDILNGFVIPKDKEPDKLFYRYMIIHHRILHGITAANHLEKHGEHSKILKNLIIFFIVCVNILLIIIFQLLSGNFQPAIKIILLKEPNMRHITICLLKRKKITVFLGQRGQGRRYRT